MPTYTTSQLNSFKKQLEEAQQKLDKLKNPSPSGQVSGSSTSGLNSAQIGGASGIGFEDTDTQNSISGQIQDSSEKGVSKSNAGNSGGGVSTFSSQAADYALRGAGLSGIVDSSAVAGKTFAEGQAFIQAEKDKRTSQVSQNTSFAFNQETLNKTSRAVDKFGFALNDVTNDPYEADQFKNENKENTINITSKEIGQLFNNSDDLYNTYNSNQQFKSTIDKFIKQGGSLDGIAKNITGSPIDNGIDNQNGNTSDFISSLHNPQANQEAEKMALEELAPESQIAQAEIARVSGIPEQLKTLYFGDEKSIGLVQMRQKQAEEDVRIIEEQEKDAKRTARDRADLQMDKNKAEVKKQTAQIEENRLHAKNYMTAQLAKLGALNTTGAAPLALQTLETKYQQQTIELETNFNFASRNIEIGLAEDLDAIENGTDEKILKIQEDITKDGETIAKEILKAQNDAQKQTYTISEQYARRLRERTTKYTADLKKEAEDYAKKFAAAAGLVDFTAGGLPSTKSTILSTVEKALETSRGEDGYVNSATYEKQYQKWIAGGGTATTFKSKFPTANYVNPEDYSLPPNLRYAKPSQTLSKETGNSAMDRIEAALE